MTKQKKEYYSVIQASIHISQSEIAAIYPDYNYTWDTEQIDKLRGVLFDLGLDTSQYFELQEVSQHRNRLGKIVTCQRYYGSERLDLDWLKSGFASQSAKDKAKNSRLLDDLYREKSLTIDAQLALESRDRYNKIEDEEGDE